jgi:glucose-1-phosphate thymidylyltransferase
VALDKEKPKHPKSNYAVVGAYFHDSTVFGIICHISPSGRGECEITSVSNEYIRRRQLEYGIVRGNWIDAGTFEALIEARKTFGRSNNYSQEGTLP